METPVAKQQWLEFFWEEIKKKWVDFLIMFLAVVCGFWVDNYLEERSDNKAKDEAARNLYCELLNDRNQFDEVKIRREGKIENLRYLAHFFATASAETRRNPPREFYPAFSSLYSQNYFFFEPKDGTLSQLKYSAVLGHFESEIQLNIGELDVSVNNVRTRNEQEYQFFTETVKPFLLKHFDFKWTDSLKSMEDYSSLKIPEAVKKYLADKTKTIPAAVLNNKNFDSLEAVNIIEMDITIMSATYTLQLMDYDAKSNEVLAQLTSKYKKECNCVSKK